MAVLFLTLVVLLTRYETQADTLPCSDPVFKKLSKLALQIRDLHPKLSSISQPVEFFLREFPKLKSSDDCLHFGYDVNNFGEKPIHQGKTMKELPEALRLAVSEFFNVLEMQMYTSWENLNPKSKFCKLAYDKLAELAKKAKPIAKWESQYGYQGSSELQEFVDLFEQVDKTRCNHVYYAVRPWFYYLSVHTGQEGFDKIPKEQQKMIEDFYRVHHKISREIYDLWSNSSQPA